MIKSELTDNLMVKFRKTFSEQTVTDAVNHIFDKMVHSLANGNRIEVRGFGSFTLHYRPPRQAHNPKTGERLMTQPKYAPYFRPGKEMRERVDANKSTPIRDDLKDDDE